MRNSERSRSVKYSEIIFCLKKEGNFRVLVLIFDLCKIFGQSRIKLLHFSMVKSVEVVSHTDRSKNKDQQSKIIIQ